MRLIADGLIYHVVHRGNHRQTAFHSDDDAAFLKAIADLKERNESPSTSTAIASLVAPRYPAHSVCRWSAAHGVCRIRCQFPIVRGRVNDMDWGKQIHVLHCAVLPTSVCSVCSCSLFLVLGLFRISCFVIRIAARPATLFVSAPFGISFFRDFVTSFPLARLDQETRGKENEGKEDVAPFPPVKIQPHTDKKAATSRTHSKGSLCSFLFRLIAKTITHVAWRNGPVD